MRAKLLAQMQNAMQKNENNFERQVPRPSIKSVKRARRRRMDVKMRKYAETVGVEENANYPKFKDKER